MAARVNAARSLEAAGRTAEAIALYEQALGSRERMFGRAHRETLAVRAQLAAAYSAAGRQRRQHQAATSRPGPTPSGRSARCTRTRWRRGPAWPAAYAAAGQHREAIAAYQRALADRERASGRRPPGHAGGAGAARERLPARREAQGRDRASTSGCWPTGRGCSARTTPTPITARGNLAYAYRSAGRLKDAVPHYERVVADRERIGGPDHRDTIAARAVLAAAYQQARRMREAVDAFERAVADGDQALGPGDVEALTTRYNLAVAYSEAGRLADAVTVLRRTLADCERHLGPATR